jgi:hypothetical protein
MTSQLSLVYLASFLIGISSAYQVISAINCGGVDFKDKMG